MILEGSDQNDNQAYSLKYDCNNAQHFAQSRLTVFVMLLGYKHASSFKNEEQPDVQASDPAYPYAINTPLDRSVDKQAWEAYTREELGEKEHNTRSGLEIE